jgi:hypothetical protein
MAHLTEIKDQLRRLDMLSGLAGGKQADADCAALCEQIAFNEVAGLVDEVERLRAACELALDFHGADTQAFVARHGHGMTTRDLCDRLREALGRSKST